MKQNKPKLLKNGTQVLEIPNELQVTKKSFLLLVNCIFQAEPLPRRDVHGTGETRLDQLIETMATLGGCATLEERLRNHSFNNPLTPDEDVNDKYVWQVLGKSKYASGLDSDDQQDFVENGFFYTGTATESDANGILHHYFRKKKKPTTKGGSRK